MGRTHTLLAATALGLGMAAMPLAITFHAPAIGLSVAAAKDHGGGDHGGKGGSHGGDKAGEHGSKAQASADRGDDKGDDNSTEANGDAKVKKDAKDKETEPGETSVAHRQDSKDLGVDGADDSVEHSVGYGYGYHDAAPTPAELGRLNGFLHASDEGRLHAAPGSAVGMISHAYADALGDYVDARSRIGMDPYARHEAAVALARAAAILGAAANKPVSPQIVAELNAEVAPGDHFSRAELRAISNRANRQ